MYIWTRKMLQLKKIFSKLDTKNFLSSTRDLCDPIIKFIENYRPYDYEPVLEAVSQLEKTKLFLEHEKSFGRELYAIIGYFKR